ncbi:hypothetical protein BH10ACT9_BH10ACT9_61010 [soil metagenome]
MAVFFRKLLGIGKLPDDMRAQVGSEGVIHLAESLPVTLRFTGQVPGRKSVGLKRGYTGALVLTNQRVLGTLSTVPKKAGRSIDQPWVPNAGGMVTATLNETGLVLEASDLSVIDPRFSGTLSLHYKDVLPPDILTRIPTRTLLFDVPSKWVTGAVGVPFS